MDERQNVTKTLVNIIEESRLMSEWSTSWNLNFLIENITNLNNIVNNVDENKKQEILGGEFAEENYRVSVTAIPAYLYLEVSVKCLQKWLDSFKKNDNGKCELSDKKDDLEYALFELKKLYNKILNMNLTFDKSFNPNEQLNDKVIDELHDSNSFIFEKIKIGEYECVGVQVFGRKLRTNVSAFDHTKIKNDDLYNNEIPVFKKSLEEVKIAKENVLQDKLDKLNVVVKSYFKENFVKSDEYNYGAALRIDDASYDKLSMNAQYVLNYIYDTYYKYYVESKGTNDFEFTEKYANNLLKRIESVKDELIVKEIKKENDKLQEAKEEYKKMSFWEKLKAKKDKKVK